MLQPLVIAAAQPVCVAHDVATNAQAHAAAIRAAQARVVVFPELSLTGYELDAATITAGDPRLAPIVEACAQTGTIALVGAPIQDGVGGPNIAMLAVDGSGAAVAYRKLWLGEHEAVRFVPGDKPAAIDVDGWRLGLAICKDTGIPEHAAETAALGIDVYVAGVLEHQEDSSIPEERARRIGAEQHVPVVIASFAGPTGDGYDHSAGGSSIWTADGTRLDQTGSEPGQIARATLPPPD